jgi:hypothetical protein
MLYFFKYDKKIQRLLYMRITNLAFIIVFDVEDKGVAVFSYYFSNWEKTALHFVQNWFRLNNIFILVHLAIKESKHCLRPICTGNNPYLWKLLCAIYFSPFCWPRKFLSLCLLSNKWFSTMFIVLGIFI